MQQQTEIFSDFIHLIKVNKDFNEKKFLYIITPNYEDAIVANDKDYRRVKKRLFEIDQHRNESNHKSFNQSKEMLLNLKDQIETVVD